MASADRQQPLAATDRTDRSRSRLINRNRYKKTAADRHTVTGRRPVAATCLGAAAGCAPRSAARPVGRRAPSPSASPRVAPRRVGPGIGFAGDLFARSSQVRCMHDRCIPPGRNELARAEEEEISSRRPCWSGD